MKTTVKLLGVFFLAALLMTGCGGGGGGATGGGTGGGGGGGGVGALETGGAGLAINQVDNGTGTAVTPNFSAAVAINDDNLVVGLAEVTPGTPFVASLWTVNATGTASVAPTALSSLTASGFAAAFAIDSNGVVVGQADSDADPNVTTLVATIWTTPTTPAALPALVGGSGVSAAYAISKDGTIIAGEAVNGSGIIRAVAWIADSPGVFTAAPTPLPVGVFANGNGPSLFNSASGVARVGATDEILVVGEAEDGDGEIHAALWRSTNGGTTFAVTDLGSDFVANGVNGSRQVVGEVDSTLKPVSWQVDAAGTVAAAVELAASGSAVAVNENGRIAGSSGAPAKATVWSGVTPATLFTTDSQAYGLNNEIQPLVVGRNGSTGFIKRIN